MLNTTMQGLVILSGIWLISVSVFMSGQPDKAIAYVGKMASTNLINYTEISLRMIWGIALLMYAQNSKFPELMHILGMFIVVTSAILFLVPRKWHAAYATYWAKKLSPFFVKIAAPFSMAFGVFLIYAVI